LQTFEELFLYSCPKFISPTLDSTDPTRVQLRIFLAEIKTQLIVPTLRSYLKLYTTLDVEKLAQLFETTDLEGVREQLLQYKFQTRQRKWVSGPLETGQWAPTMVDLDFVMKKDDIYITQTKASRRIGEWFVRNSEKLLQQL
jgi:translation initiation factor 3 subunit L